MVTAEEIEAWIRETMQPQQLQVEGDGRHFTMAIVSDAFIGVKPIARHRMVYAALGNKMDAVIHALSIQAMAPDEV